MPLICLAACQVVGSQTQKGSPRLTLPRALKATEPLSLAILSFQATFIRYVWQNI